jgi:hypothetical protein
MGPILIFDKSFLESLTVDESVWLDNFFLTNIVPIFYVETLADLKKDGKKGKVPRTPEELVKELANKTPILDSCPNVHHHRLLVSELLGQEVDMSHHRPIIQGGEYFATPDGKTQVNFKQFPEAAALERWKRHEFLELERDLAKDWRQALTNLTFDSLIDEAKSIVPADVHFSSMEDVKRFVDGFVKGKYNQLIHHAFTMLDVPEKARRPILKRWYSTRPMPFNEFAPYAAFVLKVNLFFYLCLDKTFIAPSHKGKQTNIIDLSYLYYLPFCIVFVSNDRLHSRLVPLFMEDDQTFISGHELKEDLKKLNIYYSKLPDDVKRMGTMRFATHPPTDEDTLIGRLYDEHLIPWRTNAKAKKEDLSKPIKTDKKLIEQLKRIQEEQKPYTGPTTNSDKVDSMTLTKRVPVQRGSWRILPEGIENIK